MKTSLSKSHKWYDECKNIIPGGCSTLAKSPNKLDEKGSPYYAKSSYGSHFVDIDDNDWLDCEMAMGSIVWGHAHPKVCNAIIDHIKLGNNFSIPGIWELEAAKKILYRYESYESAKFFKNGADSVYAAIRSSRFLSGKTKVLFCEYHGWFDWCAYSYYRTTPDRLGIPKSIEQDIVFCNTTFNDVISNVMENYDKLSCIVLCPISFIPEDIEKILSLCKKYHIFTIFDEVSTGIRYGRSGFAGEHHLTSDYLCISKGLTNGLPLAAVLGSKDNILIMEQLKISNAHSSENMAFWATLACENLLENTSCYPSWKPFADELMNEIQQLLKKECKYTSLRVKGYHGSFCIVSGSADFYKDKFRNHFIRHLSKKFIFSKGYILLSEAHTYNELEKIRNAVLGAIESF